MCKQHLNAFSVMARSLECFSLGQRASNVPSLLVDAPWHPAESRLWTAMRLQWATTAVTHAGHIQECLAWRAAAFVYALSQPLRAGDVGESIPGLPAEAANQLLALLANGDMLGELDDNGT